MNRKGFPSLNNKWGYKGGESRLGKRLFGFEALKVVRCCRPYYDPYRSPPLVIEARGLGVHFLNTIYTVWKYEFDPFMVSWVFQVPLLFFFVPASKRFDMEQPMSHYRHHNICRLSTAGHCARSSKKVF